MLTGWSLETPVSEAQFLRRELGVIWHQLTESDLLSHVHAAGVDRRALIICSEPEPYAALLRTASADSVVLLMISDEAYSQSRINLVRESASVAAVYRHYGTTPASMATVVKEAAAFLWAARGTSVLGRRLPRLFKTGWATRARMRQWREMSIPVHAIPLGYTNVFADALIDIVRDDSGYLISGDQSLFDPAIPIPHRARTIPLTFRGQRGQEQRRVMLERAQRQPGADIQVIGDTWCGVDGGNRGRTYVESLLTAQRSLCPPGGTNLESFRYYEALLCGAQPVEPVTALTHQGIVIARGSDARSSVVAAIKAARLGLTASVDRSAHWSLSGKSPQGRLPKNRFDIMR